MIWALQNMVRQHLFLHPTHFYEEQCFLHIFTIIKNYNHILLFQNNQMKEAKGYFCLCIIINVPVCFVLLC